MADFPTADADRPPQFREIGQQVWAALNDVGVLQQGASAVSGWITWGIAGLVMVLIEVATPIAAGIAGGIARGEDKATAAFGEIAAVAIQDALGVNVNAGAWTGRGGRGGRTGSVQQIAGVILSTLTGTQGGQLQPSSEATTRYLTYVLQMGLEGWLEGWIFEMLTSIPGFPGIETFAELDDVLAKVLGLERLSRAVLHPYISAGVITPSEWYVNKTYRPKLLAPGEAVRQFVRGRWNRDQLDEELARQGYSPDRIELLVQSNQQLLSSGELLDGVQVGLWDRDFAITDLKNAGYTQENAERLVTLDSFRRINAINQRILNAAIAAYGNNEIDAGTLAETIDHCVVIDDERRAWRDLGDAVRLFNSKGLSEGKLEDAVKRNIISVSDYRQGLARLGYDDASIGVLELLLRATLNDAEDAKRAKEQQAAEKAAEKAQKAADDAARKAAIEAERAVTEPSLSQVERAVVRGLVGTDYYATFLASQKYDSPTIGFLVGLVEQQRAEYVAQQQAAADAAARAARSQLSTGDLASAVERGILSPGEYRSILADRKLPAGDVDVLVAIAQQRRDDRVAGEKQRKDAADRAAQRGIALGDLERAVRRGIRPIGDYQATLQALGFNAADQATLVALLQSDMDADRAAAQKQADAEARAAAKGINLAQLERAVLRGVRSVDDYRALVVQLGYNATDVNTLVDTLKSEVADAQAAAARKKQLDDQPTTRPLTLAQVERAVTLGILSLQQFRAYLARYSYADQDVDTLVAIATIELQDAHDAQQQNDQVTSDQTPRALSLSQMETAVRAGLRSLDDYRALLARQGFSQADADVLAALLAQKVQADRDAAARRTQIEGDGSARSLSLSQYERAVKAGTATLEQYADYVASLGYDEADQALLVYTLAASLKPASA